jgi:hypothetical protein
MVSLALKIKASLGPIYVTILALSAPAPKLQSFVHPHIRGRSQENKSQEPNPKQVNPKNANSQEPNPKKVNPNRGESQELNPRMAQLNMAQSKMPGQRKPIIRESYWECPSPVVSPIAYLIYSGLRQNSQRAVTMASSSVFTPSSPNVRSSPLSPYSGQSARPETLPSSTLPVSAKLVK